MVRTTPRLGLSERWSLSRKNVDSPITVIYHASIPAGVITGEDLRQAADILVKTYPILSCGVNDATSRRPQYEVRENINPRSLVEIVQLDKEDTLSELVERAVIQGKLYDPSTGPLWEIQLHQIRPTSAQPSRDRIVLLIDHILCDGLGARNLFADLLGWLSGVPLEQQPEGLPARMDDTVSLQPPVQPTETFIWSYLQPYVTSIIGRISSLLAPSPIFLPFPPRQRPGYNSITAPQKFSHFELPSTDLSALLAEGKKHGVPTIHPVLHNAAIVALYRATHSPSGLSFYSSIPISERNSALGHPRSTGNYVTFHFSTDRINRSTSFWEHTREFSTILRHPDTKIVARQTLGKLDAIDGGLSDDVTSSGWEEYLRKVMDDPQGPHKLSMAVSNVGLMELPTTGTLAGQVSDVYFTQSASAMGGCAVLSIMSTRGGSLTVSVSSKVGSLPEVVFESFSEQLKPLMQAIARGDVEEETCVGDSIPGVPDV
ncbi:uncharacterized protein I303_104094 [Kwoniella dejecticola CBS 10117]|uniref:Alcohol acetyltransferase n=1 Tax=Kwoniella dejecticola CBS 10117 TaxID=1296121 RepID=A0A1A6A8K9_9TREE|nr:uncharacterized protein I303_04112 [Kwoniella dejecticola CBS 10117]OBR86388.1 hypothetical protein I303_04112 [Kwoniella dejecticola CBS 10117]